MGKIVLATIGSLGDLHPFLAIGRALAARGEQVVLAVLEDGIAKARAAGLEAAPILPGYQAICARLGISVEEAAVRIIADLNFVLDAVLMPALGASTRALDELACGADVIAGSIFAFAAEIVAEKRGLPLAAVILQPMTLFSAWQPPAAPRFALMRHDPRTAIGRAWNRALLAIGRQALRCRHRRRSRRSRPAETRRRSDGGLWPRHRSDRLLLVRDHGPAASGRAAWRRARRLPLL